MYGIVTSREYVIDISSTNPRLRVCVSVCLCVRQSPTLMAISIRRPPSANRRQQPVITASDLLLRFLGLRLNDSWLSYRPFCGECWPKMRNMTPSIQQDRKKALMENFRPACDCYCCGERSFFSLYILHFVIYKRDKKTPQLKKVDVATGTPRRMKNRCPWQWQRRRQRRRRSRRRLFSSVWRKIIFLSFFLSSIHSYHVQTVGERQFSPRRGPGRPPPPPEG